MLQHLAVNLLFYLRVFGNEGVLFQADICGLLVQVTNEHDQFLVQKVGLFRLGENRFGHSGRHGCGRILVLLLRVLSLKSILSDLIIDVNQVFQLRSQVLQSVNQPATNQAFHFSLFGFF